MKRNVLIMLVAFSASTGNCFAQEIKLSDQEQQQEQIRMIASEIESACRTPAVPVVPDGATAAREEMVEAQGAIKEFVDAGNTYLGCLEKLEMSWGDEATDNQTAVLTALFNRIVEAMETRAEEFNSALAAFRDQDAE